jgi:hypothetical protein
MSDEQNQNNARLTRQKWLFPEIDCLLDRASIVSAGIRCVRRGFEKALNGDMQSTAENPFPENEVARL